MLFSIQYFIALYTESIKLDALWMIEFFIAIILIALLARTFKKFK